MRGKSSYDYYLILATAVVLFVISAICIYGMFYFKLAQVQQLPVAEPGITLVFLQVRMVVLLLHSWIHWVILPA